MPLLVALARCLAVVPLLATLGFTNAAHAQSGTTVGSMVSARSGHAATLLPTGKVLVEGGIGALGNYLSSAELYDPSSGTWSSTGPLGIARFGHTATLLANGRVLIAGGFASNLPEPVVTELYNPNTGTWSPTGSMATARWEPHRHVALQRAGARRERERLHGPRRRGRAPLVHPQRGAL